MWQVMPALDERDRRGVNGIELLLQLGRLDAGNVCDEVLGTIHSGIGQQIGQPGVGIGPLFDHPQVGQDLLAMGVEHRGDEIVDSSRQQRVFRLNDEGSIEREIQLAGFQSKK